MKIAVLSDIHGNYIALQKCIDYAIFYGIDTFVFLGDYVGELAYPQKTMEIIYSLKEKYDCFFVKGNKEDYWLDYRANGEMGWNECDSTTGSLYYTYNNLTQKDLEFFKSLSHTAEIEFDQFPSLIICHGSPQRVNEKLLPNNVKTFAIMEENISSYILCGHSHIQGKIEHKGKVVLNAGAVGISLHGDGKAQFLILEGAKQKWAYEFISLEYDVLRTGEISHGTVLAKTMEFCRKETGECNWPNIQEKYWDLAVQEMIGE